MSALRPSPITPTVDFERDGVQHGFLRLPYSRDDSAWGSVMIPICVIRNGKGPLALLTGGNHGDEYEGPLALYELARTLEPKDVTGTVVIMPAMNYPAFRAGTRSDRYTLIPGVRHLPGSRRRTLHGRGAAARPNQARSRDAACSMAARLASTVPIIVKNPCAMPG